MSTPKDTHCTPPSRCLATCLNKQSSFMHVQQTCLWLRLCAHSHQPETEEAFLASETDRRAESTYKQIQGLHKVVSSYIGHGLLALQLLL